MNKAELLTDLASHSDIVDVLYEQQILDGITSVDPATGGKITLKVAVIDTLTIYDVPVLKTTSDPEVRQQAVQPIAVLNDGATDGSEDATYLGKKNFTEPQGQTFRDEVQQRADSFEGVSPPSTSATVIKVTLQQVFEDRQAATVTAFLSDGTSMKALLYKDASDQWQTQILS